LTLPRLRTAALAALALSATAMVAARQEPARTDGRYGLWIEDRRDSLVVHWLTPDSTAGILRTFTESGGEEFKTGSGFSHAVRFRKPAGKSVRLQFGAHDAAKRDSVTVYLQLPPRQPIVTGVDSLFILGDTHGEFASVVRILQATKLIDANLHWTGGRKHLVFDGDLTDRGPDVIRLLWFVYGLEREAAAAGGRVHVVLGNHETMVWMADLRYVNPKELALAQAYGVPYNKLLDTRESVLGAWLATKPAVLRIDDVLFAHGGVATDWLEYTPKALDDSLAKFIGERLLDAWADTTVAVKYDSAAYARRDQFFNSPNSVFWFRSYVQTDTLGKALDRVLKRFDAKLHVVGHTPTQLVHQKYDGKLLASHPRSFAGEMILLVRAKKEWARFRVLADGSVTALPSAPSATR
jgi:hypothetical protein